MTQDVSTQGTQTPRVMPPDVFMAKAGSVARGEAAPSAVPARVDVRSVSPGLMQLGFEHGGRDFRTKMKEVAALVPEMDRPFVEKAFMRGVEEKRRAWDRIVTATPEVADVDEFEFARGMSDEYKDAQYNARQFAQSFTDAMDGNPQGVTFDPTRVTLGHMEGVLLRRIESVLPQDASATPEEVRKAAKAEFDRGIEKLRQNWNVAASRPRFSRVYDHVLQRRLGQYQRVKQVADVAYNTNAPSDMDTGQWLGSIYTGEANPLKSSAPGSGMYNPAGLGVAPVVNVVAGVIGAEATDAIPGLAGKAKMDRVTRALGQLARTDPETAARVRAALAARVKDDMGGEVSPWTVVFRAADRNFAAMNQNTVRSLRSLGDAGRLVGLVDDEQMQDGDDLVRGREFLRSVMEEGAPLYDPDNEDWLDWNTASQQLAVGTQLVSDVGMANVPVYGVLHAFQQDQAETLRIAEQEGIDPGRAALIATGVGVVGAAIELAASRLVAKGAKAAASRLLAKGSGNALGRAGVWAADALTGTPAKKAYINSVKEASTGAFGKAVGGALIRLPVEPLQEGAQEAIRTGVLETAGKGNSNLFDVAAKSFEAGKEEVWQGGLALWLLGGASSLGPLTDSMNRGMNRKVYERVSRTFPQMSDSEKTVLAASIVAANEEVRVEGLTNSLPAKTGVPTTAVDVKSFDEEQLETVREANQFPDLRTAARHLTNLAKMREMELTEEDLNGTLGIPSVRTLAYTEADLLTQAAAIKAQVPNGYSIVPFTNEAQQMAWTLGTVNGNKHVVLVQPGEGASVSAEPVTFSADGNFIFVRGGDPNALAAAVANSMQGKLSDADVAKLYSKVKTAVGNQQGVKYLESLVDESVVSDDTAERVEAARTAVKDKRAVVGKFLELMVRDDDRFRRFVESRLRSKTESAIVKLLQPATEMLGFAYDPNLFPELGRVIFEFAGRPNWAEQAISNLTAIQDTAQVEAVVGSVPPTSPDSATLVARGRAVIDPSDPRAKELVTLTGDSSTLRRVLTEKDLPFERTEGGGLQVRFGDVAQLASAAPDVLARVLDEASAEGVRVKNASQRYALRRIADRERIVAGVRLIGERSDDLVDSVVKARTEGKKAWKRATTNNLTTAGLPPKFVDAFVSRLEQVNPADTEAVASLKTWFRERLVKIERINDLGRITDALSARSQAQINPDLEVQVIGHVQALLGAETESDMVEHRLSAIRELFKLAKNETSEKASNNDMKAWGGSILRGDIREALSTAERFGFETDLIDSLREWSDRFDDNDAAAVQRVLAKAKARVDAARTQLEIAEQSGDDRAVKSARGELKRARGDRQRIQGQLRGENVDILRNMPEWAYEALGTNGDDPDLNRRLMAAYEFTRKGPSKKDVNDAIADLKSQGADTRADLREDLIGAIRSALGLSYTQHAEHLVELADEIIGTTELARAQIDRYHSADAKAAADFGPIRKLVSDTGKFFSNIGGIGMSRLQTTLENVAPVLGDVIYGKLKESDRNQLRYKRMWLSDAIDTGFASIGLRNRTSAAQKWRSERARFDTDAKLTKAEVSRAILLGMDPQTRRLIGPSGLYIQRSTGSKRLDFFDAADRRLYDTLRKDTGPAVLEQGGVERVLRVLKLIDEYGDGSEDIDPTDYEVIARRGIEALEAKANERYDRAFIYHEQNDTEPYRMAKAMFDSMNDQSRPENMKDVVNRVTSALTGRKLLVRNDHVYRQRFQSRTVDADAAVDMIRKAGVMDAQSSDPTRQNVLKARDPRNREPLIVEDVFNSYDHYVDQMSRIAAFADAYYSTQTILSDLNQEITDVYGEQWKKSLDGFIESVINRPAVDQGPLDRIIKFFQKNVSISMLAVRLQGYLIQSDGAILLKDEFAMPHWTAGLYRASKEAPFVLGREVYDALGRESTGKVEADQYVDESPILTDRYDGSFIRITSPLKGQADMYLGSQTYDDRALSLLRAGDRSITHAAIYMAESEVKATRPDLDPGSPEFRDAVVRRAEQAVDMTQNTGSMLEVGGTAGKRMRENAAYAAVFGMFQSPAAKKYDMLMRSLGKMRRAIIDYQVAAKSGDPEQVNMALGVRNQAIRDTASTVGTVLLAAFMADYALRRVLRSASSLTWTFVSGEEEKQREDWLERELTGIIADMSSGVIPYWPVDTVTKLHYFLASGALGTNPKSKQDAYWLLRDGPINDTPLLRTLTEGIVEAAMAIASVGDSRKFMKHFARALPAVLAFGKVPTNLSKSVASVMETAVSGVDKPPKGRKNKRTRRSIGPRR